MKLRDVNSKVVDHPILDALYEQMPLKYDIDYRFDQLCVEQCPEDYFWAVDYNSELKLCVIREKADRIIRFEVEFPSWEDGVISVCRCQSLKEAIDVFVFARQVVGHIHGAVESVLGRMNFSKPSRTGATQ